ncbi:GTP-binding protein [Agitococcus lubricus]|uniref:Signal recognition particle receptor subunit beta n=1 Tax=Agitococcus lubricus TaxID=1077255 RepID=A0A2T5IVI6_9GAMM|nr:ATP/GTP-binding protein [Agitococcus lubricus]PTQ87896.1 hypothetical protein C8N29_11662 [Agitococcus lubricus]
MGELKFIFTGTPGAGKTTAITSISDYPPICTDMLTTDELQDIKEGTTVAMDFGEFTLESGEKILLYGTPGQERFRHMWEILVTGGLGLIILVDNSRPNPLSDLTMYLTNFKDFIERAGAVVAITRWETHPDPSIDKFQDVLSDFGVVLPIMEADPRKKEDVLMLLDMLMAVVEMNQPNMNIGDDDNEYHDALLSL